MIIAPGIEIIEYSVGHPTTMSDGQEGYAMKDYSTAEDTCVALMKEGTNNCSVAIKVALSDAKGVNGGKRSASLSLTKADVDAMMDRWLRHGRALPFQNPKQSP